jgi:hypothetical protein
MKRSLTFSVAVLVASLFVGTALKVQAATPSSARARARAAAAPTTSASDDTGGYWAQWADAASH